MVYHVREIGKKGWRRGVAKGIKQWHGLRLQKKETVINKIEKKVLNAVWVAASRRRRGEKKSEFSDVWMAEETHPIGFGPSTHFALVEKLAYQLCTVIRAIGFDAEPIRDDARYFCHTGMRESRPQAVTRQGIRISNLGAGDEAAASRLYSRKGSVVLGSRDETPRLLKKK